MLRENIRRRCSDKRRISDDRASDVVTIYGSLSSINNITRHKFITITEERDALIRDAAINTAVQEEFAIPDMATLALYIGFTASKVKDLCRKYGYAYSKVKCWYGGYLLENEHI